MQMKSLNFGKVNYLIFLICIGAWRILEVIGYGFDRSLQWWQNTISMVLLLTLSRLLSPCYHASKVTIFCKGKLFNVLELGVFWRLEVMVFMSLPWWKNTISIVIIISFVMVTPSLLCKQSHYCFSKGIYLMFLIYIVAWNILEVRGYGFDRSLRWWQNTIRFFY